MADVEKDIVLRVKSETDQAQGQFKSLKSELRSMEQQLQQMESSGQAGSEAFKQLQQQAGKVKNQIGDTKNAIKALSSDTFKLDAFAQGAQAIAGGFAAAEGAMALFGTENKAVEEAIKKTQGAMALLQGVTAITNLLQKESALMLGINTVAQRIYAFAVGTSTGAMKAFRIAMLSLGITAIIAGVVALADAMGAFSDSEEEAEEKIKKTNDALEERKKSLEEINSNSTQQLVRSRDLVKIEEQLKMLNLDKAKNYKEIYELEKKRLQLQRSTLEVELASKAGLLSPKEELELKAKIYRLKQEEARLDAQYAIDEKQRAQEAKDRKLKQAEDRSKDLEKRKKELEELRNYEVEWEKKRAEDAEKARKEAEDKAKEQRDFEDSERENSNQANLEYFNNYMESTRFQNEQKKAVAKQAYLDGTISEKEYQDTIKKLDEDTFKKRVDTAKMWMDTASQGISALMSINEAFAKKDEASQRKAFERNKKLQIAQAVMNTAEAITAQLAVPQDALTGANFVKAGIALATGIAQVKKISSTTFQGGNSAPNGGSLNVPDTSPSGGAMQTNTISSTQLQLDAQGNLKQQQVRTYVLETDISDKQKRSSRLQKTATFGR
jgi:uncharacterized membrane protein